jgi:hypothetical protein
MVCSFGVSVTVNSTVRYYNELLIEDAWLMHKSHLFYLVEEQLGPCLRRGDG